VSEDDPDIRAIYSALLTAHGFTYVGAPGGDGWATLELALGARPVLLITDVNKPGLDGHALRVALRANPATAHIAVLTVSAIDLRGMRRGPLDDYLVKPFLTETLIDRVAALLPLDHAAHDRLVARALRQPCHEDTHPVTGLPCLHALDCALGAATAAPGWAALGVNLAGYGYLARALGRDRAEGLLTRLGGLVSRAASAGLQVGHTGFDAQIAVVGPAPAVAAAATRLASASLARYVAPHEPVPHIIMRRADDRAGLGIGLVALRAALR
jgi:CheY-like chemotaxis protein